MSPVGRQFGLGLAGRPVVEQVTLLDIIKERHAIAAGRDDKIGVEQDHLPRAGQFLAIEMGCDAADIGATIHAHPTLAETVTFSAEAFEGTLTDLYIPKKKH